MSIYFYIPLNKIVSEAQVRSLIGSQVLSYSRSRQQEIGLYFAVLTNPVYQRYTQTPNGYTMVLETDPGSINFGSYVQTWNIVDLTGDALRYSTQSAITSVSITDSSTIVNSDTNVYVGSTYIPQASPDNTSGWYFKNENLGDVINWKMYENQSNSTTQQFKYLTSVWAIVHVYNINSSPYLMMYSKPTGTDDVNPSYHSVWQYDDYLFAPTSTGTYLIYWGEDPDFRRDLPRINITQIQGADSDGDRSIDEELLSITWNTSSTSVANNEEFTMISSGFVVNGKASINQFVITGQFETNADIAFSRLLAYYIPGSYPEKVAAMNSAVGVYTVNGTVTELFDYAFGILTT
jgi:hypothetical protein